MTKPGTTAHGARGALAFEIPTWLLDWERTLPEALRGDEAAMRVAIEAASPMSWYKYVGLDGTVIGMTTFGASAPYKELFPYFGLTAENVVEKALKLVK